MPVQIGTMIALGGMLFLLVAAWLLVDLEASCNRFDMSDMSQPFKFFTKFAYLCWLH